MRDLYVFNTWLKSEGQIQNNSKVIMFTINHTGDGWGVGIINDNVKSRLKFLIFIQITTNPYMYNTQNVKIGSVKARCNIVVKPFNRV